MKKTLSAVLAFLMLISTFSIGSVSAYAYPTMEEAPKVSVGDTFTVEYNSLQTNTYEYYAKFVPTETGYYEFAFASGTGKISGEVTACILRKNGAEVASDWMDEDYPDAITLAAKLTKGYAYYLAVYGEKCGTYKSDVTLQTHTHNYITVNDPAVYYKDPDFGDYIENGAVYSVCEGCFDYKKLSTIYAPKTMLLSKATYVYDGNLKKPTVTVKDKKGNTIKSSNYTVKYKNNKNVGTATVTLTFNFDYEEYHKNPAKYRYMGEMTRTFKINPKGTKISSISAKSKGFSVKWNKQSTQTTGYQLQYATDKNFTKNKKTVTISGTKNVSRTVKNLKAKKKYYVRVRTYKTVKGKKYYSSWSGYKTVTTKK